MINNIDIVHMHTSAAEETALLPQPLMCYKGTERTAPEQWLC